LVALTAVIGPARGLSRLSYAKRSVDLMTIEAALGKLLPDRGALVIAASDPSPSIDLYFMHRKGWAVTERVSAEQFEAMIRDGARYLVSDSRHVEERLQAVPSPVERRQGPAVRTPISSRCRRRSRGSSYTR